MTEDWIAVGVSVRGPGHVRKGMPNQDAYRVARSDLGDIVAVSDGVGSCPTSDKGSATACAAVVEAGGKLMEGAVKGEQLVADIVDLWLEKLEPFDPMESAATCLFAIRQNALSVILGMLGDGLVAVLMKDGTYLEMKEDKEDGFSNQTLALSEKICPEEWRTTVIDEARCEALFLCTDGVADDLLQGRREAFVRSIVDGARTLSSEALPQELEAMLENWPTPKHSDDKTIVCLFRREGEERNGRVA